MKPTLLCLLLTACSNEALEPPPTSWLDFANRYTGLLFLVLILGVINR
jgi:hypothetical protein